MHTAFLVTAHSNTRSIDFSESINIIGLDSQLVSRFCSGFVTGMTRPDRDTRLHILQEKARRQCMFLPNRVADLLADRLSGDVRLLESCLHNLKLQAQFNGHTVSEEMAMDVIRAVARTSPSLSLEDVVSLVCRSFDLTPAQLSSKSRRQNLVVARNTAFFLLRKHRFVISNCSLCLGYLMLWNRQIPRKK